jgi:hypothetical protein
MGNALLINATLIRILAITAVTGMGMLLFNDCATAQDKKDKTAKNGSGKENGKEEGDEEGWKFNAKINRPMLFWSDRGASIGNGRRRGAYNVDSDQDNTGIGLEGKFRINDGWTVGLKFSLDTKIAHSDSVSQLDRNGNTAVKIGDAHVEFGHEKWGKIIMGQSDSASDGTNAVNLAGSNVLAKAEVEDWNSSFFLRAAGTGLTGLRWGDFFAGPQAGDGGRFISYWTPKVHGVEVGVAVGQGQDIFLYRNAGQPLFTQKSGGVLTDIGIKYSGIWDNAFNVVAQFGVFKDNTEDKGATEPTEDVGLGGSFAVRHIKTGLNIAVNAGSVRHTKRCESPGEVTGQCRGNDKFVYVKGGVVREFNSWGPTAFYGEHYRGWRAQNESDEVALRALEVDFEAAGELSRSLQKMWGLGVVQTIKPRDPKDFTTDIYVGYRNYSLNVDLIGASGGAVAARKISDISMIMAGVRLRWGESDKE